MQAGRQDIYDSDRCIRSRLKLLENTRDILGSNKQSIVEFNIYLTSEVGDSRRAKYLWNLIEIAKILGEKQFIDCTERDVRYVVSKIESNPNCLSWI